MGQIEIFRVGQIPIYLDAFFVLLAILLTWDYWSSGDTQLYAAGFVLAVGLFASILLHELGHAWCGRWFGVEASAIELTGFGGLCHFERSLPAAVWPRAAIGLAGPAANLVLWLVFEVLGRLAASHASITLIMVLLTLAEINRLLLIYNLLPAFPLDGGRVLEALLTRLVGGIWAIRIVAICGLGVAGYLAWIALPSTRLWLMLIAAVLALYNYQTLKAVGGVRPG